MSTLQATETIHAPVAPSEDFSPGYYLTDGRRLFRVVSRFTTTLSPYADLEDCMTLSVDRYTPTDLYAMGLRSVHRTAA
jgi:hypothetical protein